MKILIIDDIQEMCDAIANAVSAPNIRTVICTECTAALALYRQEKPDWVFMDIRMKPVDGITLTRMLRLEHPQARIVMVTSYNDPEYRQVAKEAGAEAYVLKENMQQLRTIVRVNNQKNHNELVTSQ